MQVLHNNFKLLIVESPNKAETISSYLKNSSDRWIVFATKGHILDLPERELGLQFENNRVLGKWEVIKDKKTIVKKLAELAAKAAEIYIATDDDREGEKIAFDAIKRAKIKKYKRVVFHEITKKEVIDKLYENIREIDKNIVEAARVRRFIDREVGYPISTIIKKDFIKRGEKELPRGVGRVLSPALHLLVEREEQINNFVPEHYRRIAIEYIKNGIHFRVTNKIQFKKEHEKELNDMISILHKAPHMVYDYKRKTEDVSPKKPLITSTLQYGGWYLYGIRPSQTMKIAQELFEWGYITYHRTDSYRISDDAFEDIVRLLYEKYGEEYTLGIKRKYKNKSSAHDAHEAIRPTIFTEDRFPKKVAKRDARFTELHAHIYEFIWYRTLATQMKDAIYDASEVTISIDGKYFEAKANKRLFDGWERLMGHLIKLSDSGEDEESWKEREVRLPEFTIGEELLPLDIFTTEHKTTRPKRYGIGRFITTLDNKGIARPSTLDTIVDNLENKKYITLHKGMIYPTDLGMKVDRWVSENCPWLNNIEHAKIFEEKLDAIEKGEIENGDEIIFEYHNLVKELEEKFGINTHSEEVSSAQRELIEKIAKEKDIEVGKDIFKNKKLANAFIKQHLKNRELGTCPQCKKGTAIKGEKGIYCNRYKDGCIFYISKKALESFFNTIKVDLASIEGEKIIKKAFGRVPHIIDYTTKSGKTIKVKVVIKYSEDYGWGFRFDFVK